jgi:hypothetical protein
MVNTSLTSLPIFAIHYGLANTGIHNISSRLLSPVEQLTLGLSLKHVLQPLHTTEDNAMATVANLARQIPLRHVC